MSSLKEKTPQEIWQRLAQFEWEKAPGESYLYCNATSMWLGKALESLYGKPLAVLAQEMIFGPLGLTNTHFSPTSHLDLNQIVPTEKCAWRQKEIRGEVHDESAWAMLPSALGSAGLFSTACDLGTLVQMLLHNGQSLTGHRLLSQALVHKLELNHSNLDNISVSLGMERNNPRWMDWGSGVCLGKTGFTGATVAWRPDLGKGFALLCNWTWPNRKTNLEPIFEFRKQGTQLLSLQP